MGHGLDCAPSHRSPFTSVGLLSDFILSLPVLLFSLVAHEYAHARTALWQGDDTGYSLGRVTLNPLPHIDPWMSILVPAILWFTSNGTFLFGGAKPVPVTPRKYKHYVRGDLIVSSAGVITNFFLAFGCAGLFVLLGLLGNVMPGVTEGLATLQRMMLYGIQLNLILCFFNLIPIPPLDGSHLLYHALPAEIGAQYRSIGRFGFIPILILIMFLPAVLSFLLTPSYWGFAQFYHLVSPFGLGELWDFTRG